jgi:hypothetical protein
MPQVVFERTIPAFELAKTFYALDHAATVIGLCIISYSSVYKASVKRFDSFQFLNLRQSVGHLDGGSARSKAATCTRDSTNTE